MKDIVERLRLSASGDCPKPENAANEDKPCPYVVGRTTLHCSLTPFTLTDAEREAVEVAAAAYADDHGERFAATLRSLLSRIGDYPEPDNAASEDNESVRKTGGDSGQQPTLTDEERDVLLAIEADACYRAMERTQRVVRGLLERTK